MRTTLVWWWCALSVSPLFQEFGKCDNFWLFLIQVAVRANVVTAVQAQTPGGLQLVRPESPHFKVDFVRDGSAGRSRCPDVVLVARGSLDFKWPRLEAKLVRVLEAFRGGAVLLPFPSAASLAAEGSEAFDVEAVFA